MQNPETLPSSVDIFPEPNLPTARASSETRPLVRNWTVSFWDGLVHLSRKYQFRRHETANEFVKQAMEVSPDLIGCRLATQKGSPEPAVQVLVSFPPDRSSFTQAIHVISTCEKAVLNLRAAG